MRTMRTVVEINARLEGLGRGLYMARGRGMDLQKRLAETQEQERRQESEVGWLNQERCLVHWREQIAGMRK